MPQTVYIDGQNNVRVVDAGPPGPPGFASGGGLSGPTDLIPLPISRHAPWTGWTQFDGFPLTTYAGWMNYRMALAYAAFPVTSVAVEVTGFGPMIMGNGDDVHFLSILLAPNIRAAPAEEFEAIYEGATYRLTAMIVDNAGGGPFDRVVGEWPLTPQSFSSGAPSQDESDALAALLTRRATMPLASTEMLLGLRLDAFDGDGLTFDPESQAVMAIMQVSAWYGNLEDTPVINPSSMHTYLGMQSSVAISTRYSAPFLGNKNMLVTSNGLMFVETGASELGLDILASATLQSQHLEGDSQLVLSTERLQVTRAPTDPNDVARLQDLAGSGGTYTPVPGGVSHSITSGELVDPTDRILYSVTLTDSAAFDFSWGNVAANVVARPIVLVYGPSTGSATLEIQAAEANNNSFTVNAGEIYLLFSRVSQCNPSEGVDRGIAASSWAKIHSDAPAVSQIGEIQKTSAQATVTTGALPLTSHQVYVIANDQTLSVANPGLGKSATFIVNFHNTSGSTKYVNLVSEGHPNHYNGGSDGAGFADGAYRQFWIVVTGSASGDPQIDLAEFG